MIASCKDYHRHTSYDRHRMAGHFLDWSNQPSVYKEYQGLKVVPLPREAPMPEAWLSRVMLSDSEAEPAGTLSLRHLSQVFNLAYGLTAKSLHPGGEFTYRSVPSAGALYPCELYVAARSMPEIEDGLYHYAVGRHSLAQLRSGNDLEGLFSAVPPDGAEQVPHLIFFVTAIFFRSAWKYRARSYRYHLLDSGHLVENLVLALRALSFPCEVAYDFNDEDINSFLGFDEELEVCLALISVGRRAPGPFRLKAVVDLPESARAASHVARQEIVYPAVHEFHTTGTRLVAPKGEPRVMAQSVGKLPDSWKNIPPREGWAERMNYREAVLRRRSQRNFVKEAISEETFQAFVTLLCAGNEAFGSLSHLQQQTVVPGFLAGNVEGLDPGCYWLDRSQDRIGMTGSGGLKAGMAHACLDQEWLSQASLHFFFATNLELLEEVWGPRGYRYAMLTAGRLGQRIYLAATSLGLGCCGIGAFYDEEAGALLGLNETSVMLYLLGVGPVKRFIR